MPISLVIRHQGERNNQPLFTVTRLNDTAVADTGVATVALTAPDQVTVANRSNSNLVFDLRELLERYPDYSLESDPTQAIRNTLEHWGKSAFSTLFQAEALNWYGDAQRNDLHEWTLKIASDDARILVWPWEALQDMQGNILGQTCRIERQLNKRCDLQPLSSRLPEDAINILLVIARPGGDDDGYLSVARPLLELAAQHALPVHVDVLRPPTLNQLYSTMNAKPGFYHVVHFYGYGSDASGGTLLFETDATKVADTDCADHVESARLTQLFSKFPIPIVMLNACRSADVDARSGDPFAAVAAALLETGIRSVVTMSYRLSCDALQQFFPAFYHGLFVHGSVASAMYVGRRALCAHAQRDCTRGEYVSVDWLVPVLYQQYTNHALDFKSDTETPSAKREAIPLPPAALEQSDYGFIGRDRSVCELEHALRRQPQAGLMIHGTAGVGKTTLVKGFLSWLQRTDGLREHVFWFRFDEVYSAENLIDQMVHGLFGNDALSSPMTQKLDNLYRVFKTHPFIQVWDNFECVAGAGAEVNPMLPDNDRQLLKSFLLQLRQGKTRVIIISRSPEDWLDRQVCNTLPLGGLSGAACRQYCRAVVQGLKLVRHHDDRVLDELIEKLGGHPLALRTVLLRLENTRADELLVELENERDGSDNDMQCVYNALSLLESEFPPEYTPVLQFLGLHRRFVQKDMLVAMIKSSEIASNQLTIDHCFAALERAGLLYLLQKGQDIYGMHALLSNFLQRHHPAEIDAQAAFVALMSRFAGHLQSRTPQQQRAPFYFHGANFQAALELAMLLEIPDHVSSLGELMRTVTQNSRRFITATSAPRPGIH